MGMKWDHLETERTQQEPGANARRGDTGSRHIIAALLIAGAAIFLLAIPFLPLFRA